MFHTQNKNPLGKGILPRQNNPGLKYCSIKGLMRPDQANMLGTSIAQTMKRISRSEQGGFLLEGVRKILILTDTAFYYS
jgi:hypothetical protein